MRLKLLLLPLLLTSCVSVRIKSEPPAITAYKLDYPVPVAVDSARGGVVRIRDFSVSPDYDRLDMILITGEGTLAQTSLHRWASRPANILADLLLRDLVGEGSFLAVFKGATAVAEDVTIHGHVREFGARKERSTWHAVLDMDLTLVGRTSGIIFQKNYRFDRTMQTPGYDALAAALSTLVEEWSLTVRTDIREP